MTNDDDVLRRAHDALAGARMGVPVETIMTRGGARRRRQRAAIGASGVAAAGVVALASVLSLTGAPARTHPGGTIRTVAFTLTRNANGTDTLKLNQRQVLDPSAMQSALRNAGIPAIVHVGEFCSSSPAPPPAHGAVTIEMPDGAPVSGPVLSPGDAVMVIDPAAIPADTELTFSYFNDGHLLTAGLVDQNSYTCGSQPPAPAGNTGPAGNS